MKVTLVVVLLFGLTLCCLAQSPGMQATLSQSFFNEVNSILPSILLPELKQIQIPDQEGEKGIPLLGTLYYKLTNIKIDHVTIDSSETKLYLTPRKTFGGVKDIIKGLRIAIQADYKWKLGGSSDEGKAGILVWGGDFGVILLLGEKNGKPSVYAPGPPVGSVFMVAGLRIVLSGHDTWIFDWFRGIIEGIVKEQLEKQVPQQVVSAIDTKLEPKLRDLNMVVPLPAGLQIDLSLVDGPTVADDLTFLTAGVKAEVSNQVNPQPCPYTPAPFPSPQAGPMLQADFAQYVLNCGSYALFSRGALNYVYQNAALNTSAVEFIIPNLYNKYPNQLLSLDAYATQAPTVQVTSTTGLGVNITGLVNVSVILDNASKAKSLTGSSLVPAFSLSVEASSKAEVFFNNSQSTPRVQAKIFALYCNVSVFATQIGPIDIVTLVTVLVTPVCDTVIPQVVNAFFAQGFEVPTIAGFSLVNPQIDYDTGVLAVQTSVSYTPTEEKN